MPDVKIKGYSGTEFEYKDVPKVWLAAPESTEDNPVLVPFTYGEALENVEIVPDFSAGDIQITAPEGYLVKSGIVKKPETLVPENIAKDVNVCGIVGTHEGGGSGIQLEGNLFEYIAYQIDDDNKEIIVYSILWNKLYADTGSYDINIPSSFGAYQVVLSSKGVE